MRLVYFLLLSLLLSTLPPQSNSLVEKSTDGSTCASNMQFRSVRRILPAPSPHWVGDGFHVYPVFANLAFTQELSPLLMFDYAAPKTFPPNKKKPLGVGQHPHRGFETVTLAFQGEVEHADSTGKSDVIYPGDVQWMTAGRGIIHQEFHSKKFSEVGGNFEFCQLWVNLPKKYKMSKPSYQAIRNEKIPVVSLYNDAKEAVGTARIIAGEFSDQAKGAAKTHSPVQLWDVSLPQAGSQVDLPYPAHQNCIVFCRRGSVEIVSGNEDDVSKKASKLGPQDVAILDGNDGARDGQYVRLRVVKPDSSVLIMGGERLDEPIAAQGPFVMNTYDEISRAMSDYRSGKMGR